MWNEEGQIVYAKVSLICLNNTAQYRKAEKYLGIIGEKAAWWKILILCYVGEVE